eukprot:TRINITY_DN61275_c0_g1_i1.p2 TRINITY_DN61275_c0_g1~~TRINITY_DN61275_c0_g1_i1.p2  ORF type:complete len:136 (+),score=27.34 TRINITY_DN61275_c0_g1_i1:269-676(+)
MAVFGLGDASQAITLTANEQFLAAAREQQHTLAVLVHPSRALTGKKSLEASGALPVKYKPHKSDETRLAVMGLSLIHISEPTRLLSISYAVFCLKKKKTPPAPPPLLLLFFLLPLPPRPPPPSLPLSPPPHNRPT